MSYSNVFHQNASLNKTLSIMRNLIKKLIGLFDYKRTLTMIQVLKYYSILHFLFL